MHPHRAPLHAHSHSRTRQHFSVNQNATNVQIVNVAYLLPTCFTLSQQSKIRQTAARKQQGGTAASGQQAAFIDIWSSLGGRACPYGDQEAHAAIAHVNKEKLPQLDDATTKKAKTLCETILTYLESGVTDRTEANLSLKPSDYWMAIHDQFLTKAKGSAFVMEIRTRVYRGSVAATVDAYRGPAPDQPAAIMVVRHVSAAVFSKLCRGDAGEKAAQQKANGVGLSMAAVVQGAERAWVAYQATPNTGPGSVRDFFFLNIDLDLAKAADDLHHLTFGRATMCSFVRAQTNSDSASVLMRRASQNVITATATAAKPRRRPNQYTGRVTEKCKCSLDYVAASTTVMAVSHGTKTDTYEWHSVFPSAAVAGDFFGVEQNFAKKLRIAFQHAGPEPYKWTYKHVEYTSTYQFMPPSAVVTRVVEGHDGHGPTCTNSEADLAEIDWSELSQLKLAGMQVSTLQQRINEKWGVVVDRQYITNHLKVARKAFEAEAWNLSARQQMMRMGYMDSALAEQNAYTQLVVEYASNKDKCLVASVSIPVATRGHAAKEIVLISPLGSDELYSVSESALDAIIDPGSDGVRVFPSSHPPIHHASSVYMAAVCRDKNDAPCIYSDAL